jgi:hypothetical protein
VITGGAYQMLILGLKHTQLQALAMPVAELIGYDDAERKPLGTLAREGLDCEGMSDLHWHCRAGWYRHSRSQRSPDPVLSDIAEVAIFKMLPECDKTAARNLDTYDKQPVSGALVRQGKLTA